MDQEQYNIKKRIGIALRRFIRGTSPSAKYEEIFGCDDVYYREFTEYQFTQEMDWSNYTTVWQIDHIVPLCAFDQTNPEDLALCWNWINTRPLTVNQNKARNSYDHMRRAMRRRWDAFPSNRVAEKLAFRVSDMEDLYEPDLVDWSRFTGQIQRGTMEE